MSGSEFQWSNRSQAEDMYISLAYLIHDRPALLEEL